MGSLLDVTPASCAVFAAVLLLLALLYGYAWRRIHDDTYKEPPDE